MGGDGGLEVTRGPVVRVAEPRDVPLIAATLTVATAESRWARWALPADGRVQRLTRLHELVAGHRGVATGTTWVTDEVSAVAAWEAPEGTPGTEPVPADVAAALAREVPRLHGDRARTLAATDTVVSAVRPSEPHWWLSAVGTRPSARRQGLGVAVVTPVLQRCDADQVPAAVAVHTWANVRWLRRLGFAVVESTGTTDDQLPLYVLVRPPGGAAVDPDVDADVDSGGGSSYRG